MQPGYLAEIELGRKPGSANALRRLATVLGVAIEYLMSGDQRTRQPEQDPARLKS
jgi:transcriptional regulator with XRE-family HTH domain